MLSPTEQGRDGEPGPLPSLLGPGPLWVGQDTSLAVVPRAVTALVPVGAQ